MFHEAGADAILALDAQDGSRNYEPVALTGDVPLLGLTAISMQPPVEVFT